MQQKRKLIFVSFEQNADLILHAPALALILRTGIHEPERQRSIGILHKNKRYGKVIFQQIKKNRIFFKKGMYKQIFLC